jgi:MFS family permease
MAIAYGIGEGACMGAAQAYAMDLAPEQRRGSFLGVWSFISSGGGAVAPLVVGLLAQELGFGAAFIAVAVVLASVGGVMLLFGPDTGGRRRSQDRSLQSEGRGEGRASH